MPSVTVAQAMEYAAGFQKCGQLDAAEAIWRQVVAADPAHATAWNNLGNALSERRKFEESIQCFRKAIALSPRFPIIYNNLGLTMQEVGLRAEATACFREALEIDPSNVEVHTNLSAALFLAGQYSEGWQHYEWRLKKPEVAAGFAGLAAPQWRGERMEGETLLVFGEQGLGDTLNFIRYLPLIQAASKARIVFAHDSRLQRLFAGNLPSNVEALASTAGQTTPLPPFSRHITLLSAPFALSHCEPLRVDEPYIRVEPSLVGRWQRSANGKFRVGLVWEGSPTHARNRHRSIDFGKLALLFTLPDVEFHSLQLGSPVRHPQLVDLTSHVTDLADTAALISGLDLVIAVDTAVAHLAGAMGKPVWTLLSFVPDWRWGWEGESTPWYQTMRLFRQPSSGDWDSVIQRVVEELRETVKDRSKLFEPVAI